jgi:hypothetical protein
MGLLTQKDVLKAATQVMLWTRIMNSERHMLTSRKNRFEEINQLLLVGKRSCVRKFLN